MQFTQLLEVFQQIDVEEAYDSSSGSGGRLRMYGVTQVLVAFMFFHFVLLMFLQDGNSVMAIITDFLPYFYISAPRGFAQDNVIPFKTYLNVSVIHCASWCKRSMTFIKSVVPGEFVLKVEWMSKRSLWGYRGDDIFPFLKITVNEARNLPKVRDKYL